MRDLFTIVAVLIVAVLCAALMVPYFVNWEAHRGEVEALLSKALGVPVHTQGAIKVRLLPMPHLALEQIAIGPDKPLLTAQALNISLEAPPLLSGQIKVTHAQLLRPVMRVNINADGTFQLPSLPNVRAGATVGINKLQIEDGEIHFVGAADGAMQECTIGPVNVSASAAMLAGPWRIDGDVDGYALHLATGVPDAENRMRLKLRMNHGEFDGSVLFGKMPSIQGRLSAAYPLPQWSIPGAKGEKTKSASMVVTSDIHNDGWRIIGKKLELRIGEGARALLLTGEGALNAEAIRVNKQLRLELKLSSRRLDLSSLLQSDDMTTGRVVRSVSEQLAASFQRLPVQAAIDIGSLAVGEGEVGPVTAEVRSQDGAGGQRLDVTRLNLTLPGGSLEGHGVLSMQSQPSLAGFVQLTGTEVPRLANALAGMGVASEITDWLRQARDVRATGNIETSQEGFAVRELHWVSDEVSVNGALRYSRKGNQQRGHLEAQLTADGLDLMSLPDVDPERFALLGTDLDIALEAGHLRYGGSSDISEKSLSARFMTSPEGVKIERLELLDQGRAHLQASGQINENGGRIVASLKAKNAEAVLAFTRPFLARDWALKLGRVPADVGPLEFEATIARPEAGQPLVANLRGAVAQVSVEARVKHDPSGPTKDKAVIDVTLAHPDAVALLSSLGIIDAASSHAKMKAPGRMTLAVRGASFADLDGKAEATWGDNHLMLKGRWNNAALKGEVSLVSNDLRPVASVLHLPEMVDTAHASAKILWDAEAIRLTSLSGTIGGEAMAGSLVVKDGTLAGEIDLPILDLPGLLALSLGKAGGMQPGQIWASARFGDALSLPQTSLRLMTRKLIITEAIALEDASLQLNLSPETVALQNVEGRITQDGKVKGDIVLRRLGAQAGMRANATFEGISISALTGAPWAGKLNGTLDVGAAAENVAGLVANLAGGGELQVKQMAIPHLDPDALSRLLPTLIQGEAILTDAGAIASRLDNALDQKAWPVSSIAIPLTVAGGVVRYGPLSLEEKQARASVNGTFDLNRLYLDARAHLTAKASPEGWSGAPPQALVTWRGPIDAIVRSVDAGSAANGLATIALTRELDSIERLEAESRQRVEQIRAKRERERLEQQKKEVARQKEEAEKEVRAKREGASQIPQEPSGMQAGPSGLSAPESAASPLDLSPGGLYP